MDWRCITVLIVWIAAGPGLVWRVTGGVEGQSGFDEQSRLEAVSRK